MKDGIRFGVLRIFTLVLLWVCVGCQRRMRCSNGAGGIAHRDRVKIGQLTLDTLISYPTDPYLKVST